MDKNLIIPDQLNPLGINKSMLANLETYEDYLSFYIQLDEATSAFSWLKADVLTQMVDRLGDKSIEQLGNDIKQPISTIFNYTRTARAFPQDTRNYNISFSIHFQASFADSYNEKDKKFLGDTRFKWLDKAVDGSYSTRRLADEIQKEKHKLLNPGKMITCDYCGKNNTDTNQYVLYSTTGGIIPEKYEMHPQCYQKLIMLIKSALEMNRKESQVENEN